MKKLSLNINLVSRRNLSDLFIYFILCVLFFFTLLFISVFQVNICYIRNNDHTWLFIPTVYFLLCFASFLKKKKQNINSDDALLSGLWPLKTLQSFKTEFATTNMI